MGSEVSGVRGPSAQSLGSSCSHVRGVLGSCSIVGPWCSGAPLRDLRSKKQNSFKIPCWTIDCIQRICLWLQRSFSFRDDQTKSFCGNARKNPGDPVAPCCTHENLVMCFAHIEGVFADQNQELVAWSRMCLLPVASPSKPTENVKQNRT